MVSSFNLIFITICNQVSKYLQNNIIFNLILIHIFIIILDMKGQSFLNLDTNPDMPKTEKSNRMKIILMIS